MDDKIGSPAAAQGGQRRGTHPLQSLFDPATVAVFGASDRHDSVGGIVFANLLNGGFAGTLLPINPKHRSVSGIACRPELSAT